jgi:hypothetical protein
MSLDSLEAELKESRLLTYSLLSQLVEYRPTLVEDLANLTGDKPAKILSDARLGRGCLLASDYFFLYDNKEEDLL